MNNSATTPTTADRFMQAYGVDSPNALARELGVAISTAKSWVARDAVPIEQLKKVARERNISLDWLLGVSETQSASDRANLEQLANDSSAPQEGFTSKGNLAAPSARLSALGDQSQLTNPPPWSTVLVAEERSGWLSETSDGFPATRSEGHTSNWGSPEKLGGALLPSEDANDVRALMLSIVGADGRGKRDYHVIPKIQGSASAGIATASGAPRSTNIDLAGDWAFSHDWLARNLHFTSGNLATVQIIGDSMEPTLRDGDTIIIDRSAREVKADAIYVFWMAGTRLIKRLQRLLDGSVIVISDNAVYQRETLDPRRVREIEIEGRLVYPFQRLP